VIAAIVAGVVAIAGGVTAVVVLTGNPAHANPAPVPAPQALGNGGLIGPAPATIPATPATTPAAPPPATTAPAPAPVSTAPIPTPTAPAPIPQPQGGAIPIAGDISIRPVSGWTVSNQKRGSIEIDDAAGDCSLFVFVGKAASTDVTSELQSDLQSWVQQNGASNLQLGQVGQPTQLQGPNFTQVQAVRYQAVLSGQQGTIPVYGVFAALMNAQSGTSAFAVLIAQSQQASQRNADAADQMLGSMG
jgi:hypothetical protein